MKSFLATFILLMVASSANAMLVNIDFQPVGSAVYDGQGILGGSTDTSWNAVDFGGASNLTFADGTTVSGVNVATSFDASFSNLGAPFNARTNTLLADRLYGTDAFASQTITISGLTANSSYDIVLYNAFFAQTYSIDGQSISATTDPIAATSGNDNFPNWTQGVEYALLGSVVSDSSGQLVIGITPWDGTTAFTPKNSAIAGLQIQGELQIQSVPLPAALYLFTAGLVGLVGIARRKTAA